MKGHCCACNFLNSTIVDCKILKDVLDDVSARYPMVKFVQMISTECITDYPDK